MILTTASTRISNEKLQNTTKTSTKVNRTSSRKSKISKLPKLATTINRSNLTSGKFLKSRNKSKIMDTESESPTLQGVHHSLTSTTNKEDSYDMLFKDNELSNTIPEKATINSTVTSGTIIILDDITKRPEVHYNISNITLVQAKNNLQSKTVTKTQLISNDALKNKLWTYTKVAHNTSTETEKQWKEGKTTVSNVSTVVGNSEKNKKEMNKFLEKNNLLQKDTQIVTEALHPTVSPSTEVQYFHITN
ncbi:unnamed protein product [Thelazia callipaeda]|uniref:Uncharacterized protein n=1 Tax=Thelazia callipaeda TaxID=103827 RepID=A0A0N5CXV3_THECL|nr:unnamed protein product [Thelazia callipaeda]